MNPQIEKEDWNDLIQMLGQVELGVVAPGNGNGIGEKVRHARQALASFHTTAAMLGLADFERAGVELEQYLVKEVEPNSNMEAASVFGFAVTALLEAIEGAKNGNGNGSGAVRDISDILGLEFQDEQAGRLAEASPPPEPREVSATEAKAPCPQAGEASPGRAPGIDFTGLKEIVRQLGGKLVLEGAPDVPASFVLRFNADPAVVTQIETLLSVGNPDSCFAPCLPQTDERLAKVLNTIKDFMVALSKSNIVRSQEILLKMADQQHQAGLYNEIGGLARELHNSLRDFMETMDPALREMVEDKLPDSGNRLEHILELTERAATTTIDHVETMQRRNLKDQERIDELEKTLEKLHAIGESASKRLSKAGEAVKALQTSTARNHDDLIVVLTAQDYQDLTGQIIMKIIQLLKDLELKLVNVIRTFGVKIEPGKKTAKEDLYGPAHKAKEEALHSQDEVDNLLAEFGF